MKPTERAKLVVDHYVRGTICAAEVWHQFVDHSTEETFDDFMAQLTPKLKAYFRNRVLSRTRFSDWEQQALREKQVLRWLSDYYQKQDA